MAYTFLKKIEGIEIGKSLFDQEGFDHMVDEIWDKAKRNGVKIHLPVDFLCAESENLEKVTLHNISEGIPEN